MRFSDGPQRGAVHALQSKSHSVYYRPAALLLGLACVAIPACGFDWDSYDPRLGSSVGGSAGMGTSSATSGSSSGDAGGAGGMGGAGGSGGGMVDVCGKMDLISENFDAPLDNIWLWDFFGDAIVTLTQDMGQLVFTKTGTMADNGYAMLETSRMYDLRGNSITIEVLECPNAQATGQTGFSLNYDGNNDAGMHCQNGKVKLGGTKNGTFAQKGSFDYDPVMTRFWRMREDNGAFFWDASPDGKTWTAKGQAPTTSMIPEAVGFVRVDAYWPSNVIAQDKARFDNLQGPTLPNPHWCSASTLEDDFDDNAIAHAWSRSRAEDGCTYEEAAGQLVLHPSTTGPGRCGYRSGAAYDLTSGAVAIEIAQMVNTSANVDMRLSVDCKTGSFRISQELGMLSSEYTNQGNTFELMNSTYDAMKHHWWRIRGNGGTIYWEVSPDGKVWTEEAKVANPFDVTACDVYLSTGTGGTITMPGEARFDNLNRLP